MLTGQASVPSAVDTRFNQDSDLTAPNFDAYQGNGRRMLTVPVNNGALTPTVVGFALFFLQPRPCGAQNSSACCGEYVGPAVVASTRRGAGTPGLYAVQLVQ
jgi:hypothetical protein